MEHLLILQKLVADSLNIVWLLGSVLQWTCWIRPDRFPNEL